MGDLLCTRAGPLTSLGREGEGVGVVGGLDWSTYVTHTLSHPGSEVIPVGMCKSLRTFDVIKLKFTVSYFHKINFNRA